MKPGNRQTNVGLKRCQILQEKSWKISEADESIKPLCLSERLFYMTQNLCRKLGLFERRDRGLVRETRYEDQTV